MSTELVASGPAALGTAKDHEPWLITAEAAALFTSE